MIHGSQEFWVFGSCFTFVIKRVISYLAISNSLLDNAGRTDLAVATLPEKSRPPERTAGFTKEPLTPVFSLVQQLVELIKVYVQ